MFGCVGDFPYGAVEDLFVGLGRFGCAGDLAYVLQGGVMDLGTRRRRLEVVQRSNVAAHGLDPNSVAKLEELHSSLLPPRSQLMMVAPLPMEPRMSAPKAAATSTILEEPPEQRRTLAVLVLAQILSGAGLAAGVTVGVLLAQEMLGSTGLSGLSAALFSIGGAAAAEAVGRAEPASWPARRAKRRLSPRCRRELRRRGCGLAGQSGAAAHLFLRLRRRSRYQPAGPLCGSRPCCAVTAWPCGEHRAGRHHHRCCGRAQPGERDGAGG